MNEINFKHRYGKFDYSGICHICNNIMHFPELMGTIFYEDDEQYKILSEGLVICNNCGQVHLSITVYKSFNITNELSKLNVNTGGKS
jgi:hypothetical protein